MNDLCQDAMIGIADEIPVTYLNKEATDRGLSAESGAGPKLGCGSNESWLIVALRLRLTGQKFRIPKSCDQQPFASKLFIAQTPFRKIN